MAATEYIVLRQASDEDEVREDPWLVVATVTASSADAAVREVALAHGDGTYVATPARSWQPAAMKVEPRAVAVKEQT